MQKQESQFLVDLWSTEVFSDVMKLISFDPTSDGTNGVSNIGPRLWEQSETYLFKDEVPVVEPIVPEEPVEVVVDPSIRKKRSATNGKMAAKNMYQQLNKHVDPHLLVAPYYYGEEIGPCPDSEQPFSIVVHPQVGLLCDLHGHLCDAEVIGLLAGRWDGGNKTLYIQAAFPCTSTDRRDDDGFTDVELDSEAEFKVRSAVESLGMTVVGWYHSHPLFKPDPSVTDIANQFQYQSLMKDATSGCEPFVGLIVSTYDKDLPSDSSRHQWFCVTPYSDPASGFTRPLQLPMILTAQYKSLHYNANANEVSDEIKQQFDELLFGLTVKLPPPPVCIPCDKPSTTSSTKTKYKEDDGADFESDEDDDSDFGSSSSKKGRQKKGVARGGGKGGKKAGAAPAKGKRGGARVKRTAVIKKELEEGGDLVPLTSEEVEHVVKNEEQIVKAVKKWGGARKKGISAATAAVGEKGFTKAGLPRKTPGRKKSSASIEEKLEHGLMLKEEEEEECAEAAVNQGGEDSVPLGIAEGGADVTGEEDYAVGMSVRMDESNDAATPVETEQRPLEQSEHVPSPNSTFVEPPTSDKQSDGEDKSKLDAGVQTADTIQSEISSDLLNTETLAVSSDGITTDGAVKEETEDASRTVNDTQPSLTSTLTESALVCLSENEVPATTEEAALQIISQTTKRRASKKVAPVVLWPRVSMRAVEKKTRMDAEQQMQLTSTSSEMQVELLSGTEHHASPPTGKRRKRAVSHATESSAVEDHVPKRRYTRRATATTEGGDAATVESAVSTRSKPVKALPVGDPRWVSFLLSLQDKEYESSDTARCMLRASPASWRFLVLMIVSLTFYYSRRSPRIDLSKKWRTLDSKLEKIRLSAAPWAKMLGLISDEDARFIEWIKKMLEGAWKDYAKCITKVTRLSRDYLY